MPTNYRQIGAWLLRLTLMLVRRSNLANLPKLKPTALDAYWNRRQFLQALGMATGAAIGFENFGGLSCSAAGPPDHIGPRELILQPGVERMEIMRRFPVARNAAMSRLPGEFQDLTDPLAAATHNNFYEFLPGGGGEVWRFCRRFTPDPWSIEITGLCHKPRIFDLDDLFALELEERVYRFRCVERWAMDVPWTGVPFHQVLTAVEPNSNARYVRFITASPEAMGGRESPGYDWPYYEALRMDEAMNELTLLATGVYGQPLPRQHGAPARMVLPWKYGYKGAKSIVRIELVDRQPPTFWNDAQPTEYDFLSNIDPAVPHPRWAQNVEQMLDTGEHRPTLKYGGYGQYVAHLYE